MLTGHGWSERVTCRRNQGEYIIWCTHWGETETNLYSCLSYIILDLQKRHPSRQPGLPALCFEVDGLDSAALLPGVSLWSLLRETSMTQRMQIEAAQASQPQGGEPAPSLLGQWLGVLLNASGCDGRCYLHLTQFAFQINVSWYHPVSITVPCRERAVLGASAPPVHSHSRAGASVALQGLPREAMDASSLEAWKCCILNARHMHKDELVGPWQNASLLSLLQFFTQLKQTECKSSQFGVLCKGNGC